MTTVLIAYDSRRGSVERLAQEVQAGAQEAGAHTLLRRVQDVTKEELLSCDGLAVGSPVHTGTVSAPVKQFFDDWQFRFGFYPERPLQDKIGAAFSAGGQEAGGREFVLLTILSALLHHQFLVLSGGSALGASAATETKDVSLDSLDLAQARALGRRLAEVCRKTNELRSKPRQP